MKKILLILLFIGVTFSAYSQKAVIPVIIDGDQVNYLREQEKVEAVGNVVMKYKGVVINCDKAVYSSKDNYAVVTGNIKIVDGHGEVVADKAEYDFINKTANIYPLKMDADPMFGAADNGEKIGENEYLLHHGYITTCDLDNPHYRLTAKNISIYPNDRIVSRNMLLKVGKFPVFWFPYYSQSLEDGSFPLDLSPGKSKEWGIYTLSRWKYFFDKKNKGKVFLDYYEDRGFGKGVSHFAGSSKFGNALINLYSIDDQLYNSSNREDFLRVYDDRSTIDDKYLENNRYKTQIYYDFNPTEKLSIKAEYHKFSDKYFMKDFFYREYEKQANPLTYALFDYSLPGASLSLLTQKRVNRFYNQTEYLPKVEYNVYRNKVGDSPVYFESKTSLSSLTKKFENSHIDYDSGRIHTRNIFALPKKISWLYISPYIGAQNTYYSKNSFGDEERFRNALETGITLSTKLFKYFDSSFTLGGEDFDQMRHIINPSIEYSYIHEPTIASSRLFQFDDTDALARKDTVIFRFSNKFQAKNDKRKWDVLYFSPAAEYRFNEEGKGSYFHNITTDMEFYPFRWLTFTAKDIYSVPIRRTSEFHCDLSIRDIKDENYSFSLGHRYIREDSSLGIAGFEYQITPKLRFSAYANHEYNTGDFKQQEYKIRRDLHCWWMDLGVSVDVDGTAAEGYDKNYTFWVIFTLKDFPKIHLGFDHSYSGARKEY